MTERRAPVQMTINPPRGAGTVSWAEHLLAWEAYEKEYPGQSAERIAERGGFCYNELCLFLGRPPTTWVLR